MKKYLFLDIDGVLNSHRSSMLPLKDDNHSDFDKEAIDNLNYIVEKTSSNIVISSTWRLGSSLEELQKIFYKRGFNYSEKITSLTPRLYVDDERASYKSTVARGVEIKHWIFENVKEWYLDNFTYCILDDDEDMLYSQRNNFILTDATIGLTREQSELAIKILNKL